MNADTKVYLAHVQAFIFHKLESLAGENIILLYLFGKKNNKIYKINNFQVSKQFQRTHSVLFRHCIEL